MKTKHIFVPALDVGELLPFVVKKTKTLQESIKEQERARNELVKFIDKLEKNYRETIYYIGMDIIESKSYERFIFDKGGFFEVMTETPLAMSAHFVHDKQARKFCNALKKTIKDVLKNNEMGQMFVDSVEVGTESDPSLTFKGWNTMKNIKKPEK